MKPGDHLILVDGSSFIFRAFHALPPLNRKSDGLPTSAVLGFCNMIWKLLQEGPTPEPGDEPTHFAVIFDYSAKTFRSEIYADYKAHRPEPPSDLIPQFGLIREATRAFNLPCIEQEGWEADDIIATYAIGAQKAGATVHIVSSDKDLMQIVRPGITMVDTLREQIRIIDRDFVKEKYGVYPEKMIDLQALCGDSTDNVPGVPGIGPKTASQLLDEYGDLESLLERAWEIKQPKRRQNLMQFAEQARISRKLVELCCEVPLDVPLDDLAIESVDGVRAVAFSKALEFTRLAPRIATATGVAIDEIAPATPVIEGWPPEGGLPAHGPDMGGYGRRPREAAGPPAPAELRPKADGGRPLAALGAPSDLVAARKQSSCAPKIDTGKYHSVRRLEDLERWVAAARTHGIVAIKAETTSRDPLAGDLCGIALALEPGFACYVPVGHRSGDGDMFGSGLAKEQIPLDVALAALKLLVEDPTVLKVGQDIKFEWLVLARHGLTMAPLDDAMLMSYALDAGARSGHGMEGLCKELLEHEPIELKTVTGTGKDRLGFDQVGIEQATAYAAEEADVALRLWRVLKPRLAAERVTRVYERLERPMVSVLASMEQRGIKVDRQILSRLSGAFAQKAGAVEAEIYELAGESFNIGSTKQLGDILFGKLGIPGGRKTRTGQWSTDVKVLEDLAAEGVPIARKIVEWRQLTKLKSTYTDALPGYMDENGRIHTSYSLASTSTGRLSSSEPNLQNIPVRTEEGRAIRKAFIAEDGWKLVSADYSQIELRVLAHMAEIPQLTRAFADGLDIHAMTASEMFGVPVAGMDPMIRRRAKAINFGIIYGISAFGLAAQLAIPRGEAADYIARYFERFPGIRDYMDSTKAFCREHLYVETLFGRRAHYPDIRASQPSLRAFQERAAINAPIQGSAADIIRRAMIRMDEALESAGLRARMLLQVHDELVFEVPDDEVDDAIPVIRQVMESAAEPAVKLRVPLQVDARAARNWEEAH
jgi:DNA polymerase-1